MSSYHRKIPYAKGQLLREKYGKLTIVCDDGKVNASGARLVGCECECGNTCQSRLCDLKNGHKRSCGCLAGVKHRGSKMPEYNVWKAMHSRCYRENNPEFPNYGHRGITVCDRWLRRFDLFLADMGPRPSSEHSLDRINVNGNYEPSNCRWATIKEQNVNRRQTIVKANELEAMRRELLAYRELYGPLAC